MSAHPVLIRNPMQPDGKPSELLRVHGRAYQSRPALYYVDGPFTAIGLAVARGSTYKCGYIDRSGARAIAPRFEPPAPFSRHGVAPASENGRRFGIINQQGEWVLAPCYDEIETFNDDGLAWFKADDNQEGYLDAAGIPVIPDCYDLSRTMRHGVAVERAAQRWYRSADDVPEFGEAFDWAGDFNTHGFALARAVIQERGPVWGIARLDGTFAAVPADVLEPLPDWDNDIGYPEPGTPLIAFLARDGSIALLDRDARVAFRPRAESDDGGEQVALYDQTGRQLWQDAPCAALHAPQPYFSAYAGAEPDRDTLAWRVGALWLGIAGVQCGAGRPAAIPFRSHLSTPCLSSLSSSETTCPRQRPGTNYSFSTRQRCIPPFPAWRRCSADLSTTAPAARLRRRWLSTTNTAM
ncbi:WG repeat-containing protein [Massilia violaceinigra]|uniref:WG repeat-containing protein n=1 Tax=Massilia violaceinigra TaxID=2045208 RepID=A0ABY4A6K3_9BURK|nr:WG repeat-containing protein [Massilia violaceinigra]UOD30282.1 WG repeat-containing protein [Massilia violaceinigra]